MNLKNQVCSLELAKRLKELGVKQESIFWYTCFRNGTADISFQYDSKYIPPSHYAAFTVAELGEILPDHIIYKNPFGIPQEYYLKQSKKDNEYKIYIEFLDEDGVAIFFSENEANARAKMLIYLLENKLMELPNE